MHQLESIDVYKVEVVCDGKQEIIRYSLERGHIGPENYRKRVFGQANGERCCRYLSWILKKKGKNMQMEKNEDGGSKESTRMTRRQGAERHSARTLVLFSRLVARLEKLLNNGHAGQRWRHTTRSSASHSLLGPLRALGRSQRCVCPSPVLAPSGSSSVGVVC